MFSDVIPLRWRLGNAVVSSVAYLGQLFYPFGLAVLYIHPQDALPIWKIVAASLVLIGVSAVAWFARRKCPYLLVGWLWYLGMLVPVIGLVQVGGQAMADRYTYLPLVGPCVALAWGAADIYRLWLPRRWLWGVSATLVVVGLMGCAWRQTSFWRNSETLWKHALTVTPRSVTVYLDLGTYYLEKNRLDEAIFNLQKALEVNPGYPKAHNGLGLALQRRGQLDEALDHYRKAVATWPDYPEANNNLANVLAQRGRLDEAIVHYRRALKARPTYAKAMLGLGVALGQRGCVDEAMVCLQTAMKLRPDLADARRMLGGVRRRGTRFWTRWPGSARCSIRARMTSLC